MKIFTIPNFLTCCNLLCGAIGIIEVFHSNLILSCWLLIVGGIFDFFDGFAARLLKSSSPIGKELDSLADVVTFGVLPGAILYSLIQDAVPDFVSLWKAYLGFGLITVFSALRLAKFNIDTRQSESFIGVPTPANGLLVASLPLIIIYNPEYQPLIVNQYLLLGYAVVMSYLLISEIPLFALKFKSFDWPTNKIKYIFILLSVILLAVFKFAAIPLIIIVYIILSGIDWLLLRKPSGSH
jgi:CDP-diacylglycerol---serine O-phosphatidyltransferase